MIQKLFRDCSVVIVNMQDTAKHVVNESSRYRCGGAADQMHMGIEERYTFLTGVFG